MYEEFHHKTLYICFGFVEKKNIFVKAFIAVWSEKVYIDDNVSSVYIALCYNLKITKNILWIVSEWSLYCDAHTYMCFLCM